MNAPISNFIINQPCIFVGIIHIPASSKEINSNFIFKVISSNAGNFKCTINNGISGITAITSKEIIFGQMGV